MKRSASKISKAVVAVLAGLPIIWLSGCANSQDLGQSGTANSTQAVLPAGGKYLTDYGFKNGPAGFSLPDGLMLQNTVDNKKTVSLMVKGMEQQDQNTLVKTTKYLHDNLASMGFETQNESESAIVFHSNAFKGAWVCSGNDYCSLSIRKSS